jgi:hypothetical protein
LHFFLIRTSMLLVFSVTLVFLATI